MNTVCVFLCLCATLASTFASDYCVFDGKRYKPGDRFIIRCSMQCQCDEEGTVGCKGLCPPTRVRCRHDEVIVESSRKAPNSNCSCPFPECVKATDVCYDGGNRYKPGDSFIAADCSGKCTCSKGGAVGCVTLCPPSNILCRHDEVKVESSREIPNSNCSCPTYSCRKQTKF